MTATQDPDSAAASDDLSGTERALLKAATTGEMVDLRTGDADLGPASAADWNDGRNLRAAFLADLLTGEQPTSTGRLRFVKLRGARITGTLDLEARKILCPVVLEDCYFDQAINLDEAEAVSIRLPGSHAPSLSAEQLRTVAGIELNAGFTVHGGIFMPYARIGGQFNLDGAVLANDRGDALYADGLSVDQDMRCCYGFTAQGGIRLLGARIGGELTFEGASLAGDDYALAADMITVGKSLYCRDEFTARGEVRLIGAHIGGQFSLLGASLTNDNGLALYADMLTVDQSMLCYSGFTARGEVRLEGARIGGQFSLNGASLINDDGLALNAYMLTVDQDMLCYSGFTARGEVRLAGARIGGKLAFSRAALNGAGQPALRADGLTVDQQMPCDALTAQGEIRLPGAHIGGYLDLSSAELANDSGPALRADGLTVGQGMYCGNHFTAQGEIRLSGARIGGQLSLSGAELANDSGPALRADNLIVAGDMFCDEGFTAHDGVNLAGARVGVLWDDQASWPGAVHLGGFVYARLGNPDVSVQARLRWLRLHTGRFTPQIYDQLADVYRRAGDDGAARKVLIAKQRRRGRYDPLSWLWYITVGYGYRTWQAFIWAAVLVIVGALVFSGASPAHIAAQTAHPPRFQPAIYTLDVMLPIGALGQKTAWQPTTSGLLAWYWVLSIAGWILSAAVVAGLTGILKRD